MNFKDNDTATLVMKTLAGEQRAYEELVIRYERAVIAAARDVTGNEYIAEDAAQDAFVSAWMKLDMLREPEKFGSWVCRISKNCAKNLAVRYRDYINFDDVANREYETGECYDELLLACEDENDSALQSGISTLPEKIKTVIRLHYFEGYSIAEIADMTKVKTGTVKWQLHEGRKRLRKGLDAMNEKENDTLVQKVMKKIEELKLFCHRNNREGFEKIYADVLSETEALPESEKKYSALADVLQLGFWYLPGEKNNEIFARMKEAAERGKNDDVMQTVVSREHGKLSGKEKIEYMRDKQIPYLEENGFLKSLGYVLFWLGRVYFLAGDKEAGFASFERVKNVLSPSDKYYACAIAAIKMEKTRAEKNAKSMSMSAVANVFRFDGGKLYLLSQPGYGEGGGEWLTRADYIIGIMFICDGIIYDEAMKPGETYKGSDGISSLAFVSGHESVNTAMGVFENCELWISRNQTMVCKMYIKENVGVVRFECSESGETDVVTLKSYEIKGGSGKIPFAAGNRWEYSRDISGNIFEYANEMSVTSFDGRDAVMWHEFHTLRSKYDENSFDDMMLSVRRDYVKTDGEGEHLADISGALKRAGELIKTPFEHAYYSAASSVMERIMATDTEFNPGRTAHGMWNFFNYDTVSEECGKTRITDNRRYSFEWKDRVSGAAYPLLYNDILGILNDSLGYIYNSEWQPGYSEKIKHNEYRYNIETELSCIDAGKITVVAGDFDGCMCVMLDVKGFSGGLGYRNGKKEYYFAPGIGIIRAVSYYKNGTLKAVYELSSYKGEGEGYMPLSCGMFRRYEATGLTEGHIASSEYTCALRENGTPVIFENREGIKLLNLRDDTTE
ncbi:MAG: RNA polymerase sigma factor [Eubacteriales bacterium]